MKKFMILNLVMILISYQLYYPAESNAFLFHATKKTVAKRIMTRGFLKMKPTARYGKGVYVSGSRKTALKEKPKAETVMKLRESKYLKKNTVDLRKPTPEKLRKLTKTGDLRGDLKNNMVGQKLGKKIGSSAARKGKVIRYQSAKDPKGVNVFIPQKVYQQHPKIIQPEKAVKHFVSQ